MARKKTSTKNKSGGNKGYSKKIRAHYDKFPEQVDTVPARVLAQQLNVPVTAIAGAKHSWKKMRAKETNLAEVAPQPSMNGQAGHGQVETLLQFAQEVRELADRITLKATQLIK